MKLEARKLTFDELVLAYELRAEGIKWKYIAIGLDCDWIDLQDQIKNIEIGGMFDRRRKFIPLWAVQCAINLRQHGFGWHSIASYVGMDYSKVRFAASRELLKLKR